jgi:hypothetical protein
MLFLDKDFAIAGAIMNRSSRQALLLRSPVVVLAAYFVVVAGALIIAAWISPGMRHFLLPSPPVTGFGDAGTIASPYPTEGGFWERSMGTGVVGVLSLIGALIFAIPVVRIYTVIMRQQGYQGSFVRLLVGLPVVVAGVVQVVRGDLALAFALAGIVAAIRFRTTVEDLQDAVFAFVAIGIGLAAGTASFVLAGALSTTFTFLAWSMWRLHLGEVEPSLELAHGGVALSAALVPGEENRGVIVGDETVVSPVTTEDIPELANSIDRLASYVRADALRRGRKYGSLLLAYVNGDARTKQAVESVIDQHASRWVYVDRIDSNHGSGVRVLEYLVRLKKKVEVGKMFDAFEAGPNEPIRAVELKPIRGFRKRIT